MCQESEWTSIQIVSDHCYRLFQSTGSGSWVLGFGSRFHDRRHRPGGTQYFVLSLHHPLSSRSDRMGDTRMWVVGIHVAWHSRKRFTDQPSHFSHCIISFQAGRCLLCFEDMEAWYQAKQKMLCISIVLGLTLLLSRSRQGRIKQCVENMVMCCLPVWILLQISIITLWQEGFGRGCVHTAFLCLVRFSRAPSFFSSLHNDAMPNEKCDRFFNRSVVAIDLWESIDHPFWVLVGESHNPICEHPVD